VRFGHSIFEHLKSFSGFDIQFEFKENYQGVV